MFPTFLVDWIAGLFLPPVAILVIIVGTIALGATAFAEAAVERASACDEAAPQLPALEKWTARLTDPAPGQCPVCSYDDLAYWHVLDQWSLRVGDECHVQPYGRHEAHRFCAEFVPYLAPPPSAPARPIPAVPEAVRVFGVFGGASLKVAGPVRPGTYEIDDGRSREVVYIVCCSPLVMPQPNVCEALLNSPLSADYTAGAELRPVAGGYQFRGWRLANGEPRSERRRFG
jgi:hypothetical protein